MLVTKTQIGTAVRCSIILPAANEPAKLNDYLLYLSAMKLSDDYEIIVINDRGLEIDERRLGQLLPALRVLNVNGLSGQERLFDIGARAARGRFLLFVRNFIKFDKLMLQEALDELENSGEKLSVSANKNFVLVEKFQYECAGGFEQLFGGIASLSKEASAGLSERVSYFKNIYNETVPFKCSRGTFIDPEVVIDSPESVKIGSNCTIRKGVVLRPESGQIIIGDNCVINHYCVFHGKGGIYIGDWTIVEPHCGLYAQNHTYESFDVPITKQPNVGKGIYLMGDNLIGAHSVICDDVTLGKGAVVGANSTATKSVPMSTIAAGFPAKAIKNRHSGDWDFPKAERAASEGMPQEIYEHVRNRGMLIKELISPKDRILDIGCGEGIITAVLAEKSRDIIGCDYSIEAVEVAAKQHPNIEFTYSNSTNMAFNDESFTKVTMSDVAEHLMPVQFIKTLDQINRVLKKVGMLILATPITGNAKNTSTYAHIYEYSEEEMYKILNETFCKVKLINKKFGIFVAQKR